MLLYHVYSIWNKNHTMTANFCANTWFCYILWSRMPPLTRRSWYSSINNRRVHMYFKQNKQNQENPQYHERENMEYDLTCFEARRGASAYYNRMKDKWKRDRGRPRTSCIKKIISDPGLINYKELKRLADNIDEWKNYGNCKTNLRVEYK